MDWKFDVSEHRPTLPSPKPNGPSASFAASVAWSRDIKNFYDDAVKEPIPKEMAKLMVDLVKAIQK